MNNGRHARFGQNLACWALQVLPGAVRFFRALWWRRDSLPSRRLRRSSSPYLHNVKGELLLVENPSDVAEAELRTAIEIARRQSARWPELGATTYLARLLAKQGRRDEARKVLAEDLRLVHRRLRHRRPERSEGAIRRTSGVAGFCRAGAVSALSAIHQPRSISGGSAPVSWDRRSRSRAVR